MKKKTKQTTERIHTRKLDRMIAKKNMKKDGMRDFTTHSYNNTVAPSGKAGERIRIGSVFADTWRKFIMN